SHVSSRKPEPAQERKDQQPARPAGDGEARHSRSAQFFSIRHRNRPWWPKLCNRHIKRANLHPPSRILVYSRLGCATLYCPMETTRKAVALDKAGGRSARRNRTRPTGSFSA